MIDPMLLLLPVLLPLLGGAAMFVFGAQSTKQREVYVQLISCATSLLVFVLLFKRPSGTATLLDLGGDVTLALRMDGLSLVFAAIVAVLWPIAVLYSFEYMRHEHGENRFFAFFTMTYGVVLGIAFAANAFTLYLFYELLTLCTLPLVMHQMDGQARFAGKKYLAYSMAGAALAFVSMMFLMQYGSLDFVLGGSLAGVSIAGHRDLLRAAFVIGFFGFGVKAAVWPLHGWLPSAGVAPTPVTALLHAVAVVNAGVFAILRLIYYSYGTQLLSGSWAQMVVMAFAVFTIVYGSAMALRLQHLKRRLAYSTISNLSYILFAATLMTPGGLSAGLCHMVVHSALKITLFFCAGALLCQTHHKEYISDYEGLGKRMPVTFTIFTIASLGLIGVPLFAGFGSKWAIASKAAALNDPLAWAGAAALVISAFLTGLYQMGVIIPACFPRKGHEAPGADEVRDPGWRMITSLVLLTALCFVLSFGMQWLYQFLTRAAAGLV